MASAGLQQCFSYRAPGPFDSSLSAKLWMKVLQEGSEDDGWGIEPKGLIKA